MKYHTSLIVAIIIPILVLAGCGTSNTLRGGAIGAGAGGIIGGIIGEQHDNTAAGAIIGAAVGGTAGALIGRYMDQQAEEMRRELNNARVERIGEGIKVTLDSAIIFAFDSASLQEESRRTIEELSNILIKYEDTNILIEGHTDSQGSDEYNQRLSERRAQGVADYAVSRGLSRERITTVGHGETMPVASNDTDEGRRLNRRVEIAVFANEELKEAAEKGKLPDTSG